MTGVSEPVWQALQFNEVVSLFSGITAPWWIAGGVAIDLFLERESRIHEDLDIVINRADQEVFFEVLSNWDLQETIGPGILRPIEGKPASLSINAIWCRENQSEPWRFEFLLSPFSEKEWIYRRVPEIRGPIETFGWQTKESFLVIAPEI